jgi:hypothetical protein
VQDLLGTTRAETWPFDIHQPRITTSTDTKALEYPRRIVQGRQRSARFCYNRFRFGGTRAKLAARPDISGMTSFTRAMSPEPARALKAPMYMPPWSR